MPETVQDTLFRSLPRIYRREGKDGLTYRLLGLFADVLEGIEDKVYGLHRQLDVQRADARFLPWLASWVALISTVEVDTKVYGTWEENAHRFSVLVATFEEFDAGRKAKVRERVLLEKPAHTQLVHVGWSASYWRIGVRSTLGVDTKVGG